MMLDFLDKLTRKQSIYLWSMSLPLLLALMFNWFGEHYIIGGIAINIVVWSWFSIIVWNNTKEKAELRNELNTLKKKYTKVELNEGESK